MATCFGLKRRGITNTCIFDTAPKGGEGPWITFARMLTLRTPKYVTGPDLGIPSLTPQSWYEARYGAAAWHTLDKISRQDWQAYLDWVRDVLDLPVKNEHELLDIDWQDNLLKLTFACAGGVKKQVWARKIVLATGIEGGGAWHVPGFITKALPKARYAHTCEQIDFEKLRGKRIGVLGAGASAFDNAATALEHGAKQVDRSGAPAGAGCGAPVPERHGSCTPRGHTYAQVARLQPTTPFGMPARGGAGRNAKPPRLHEAGQGARRYSGCAGFCLGRR